MKVTGQPYKYEKKNILTGEMVSWYGVVGGRGTAMVASESIDAIQLVLCGMYIFFT
jgi:hypothetical protein